MMKFLTKILFLPLLLLSLGLSAQTQRQQRGILEELKAVRPGEGKVMVFEDKAIADRLSVSNNTVRNHVARIYSKIGVNKRSAAVIWARERGLSGASHG